MPPVVYLIPLIGPLVLIAGLILVSTKGAGPPAGMVKTTGRVIAWDHRLVGGFSTKGNKRSLPVVRFTTERGQEMEALPKWAADRMVYRTGQEATVFYDPADPRDFRVRIGWLDRPYALLVVVGVALTVLTVRLPLLFWLIS